MLCRFVLYCKFIRNKNDFNHNSGPATAIKGNLDNEHWAVNMKTECCLPVVSTTYNNSEEVCDENMNIHT